MLYSNPNPYGYTEEDIEEFYNTYQNYPTNNPFGYTDAYVATDTETLVPVMVGYNENNLSSIGLQINQILKLGDFEKVVERLDYDKIQIASNVYIKYTFCEEKEKNIDGVDRFGSHCIYGYIEKDGEEYLLFESKTLYRRDGFASIPSGNTCRRGCWNVMINMLRNFVG